MNPDLLGMWVAFVLTLLVYSYLLGDNPLFRLAQHLFVGTAVGYALVIAWHSVLVPRLLLPLSSDPQGNMHLVVPLLLGLLLLLRARPAWAGAGRVSMAFLFGVGAALAVGGGVWGTLVPQVKTTMVSLVRPPEVGSGEGWVWEALLLVLGTVSVLFVFYFAPRKPGRMARWKRSVLGFAVGVGRFFLFMVLGAVFANTAMSRVSLLVERLRFLLSMLGSLLVR